MSPQDLDNLDQYGDADCYPQYIRHSGHYFDQANGNLGKNPREKDLADINNDLASVDYEIQLLTRWRKHNR